MAKMLEGILNKIKKPLIGGLVSSMIFGSLPKISYAEWESEGTSKQKTIIGISEKTSLEYKIDINNPKLSLNNDSILVPVTKSEFKSFYERYKTDTIKESREYKYRTVIKDSFYTRSFLLSSAIMAINYKHNKNSAAALAFAGLVSIVLNVSIEKQYTGNTSREVIDTKELEYEKYNKEVYVNKPAADTAISVYISNTDYFKDDSNGKTDSDGYINIIVKKGAIKHEGDNFILYDRKGLCYNDLMEQMSSSIRKESIKTLLKKGKLKIAEMGIMELKTAEQDSPNLKIINDKKRILPLREYARDSDIFEFIEEFVDSTINDKTKLISLKVYDKYSSVGIPSVKVQLIDSPKPKDILGPYFKGELLGFASGNARYDYHPNDSFSLDSNGERIMRVYPGSYSLKVIHPDYYYRNISIDFTKPENNQIEVEMTDLGKKVRVKEVSE